MGKIVGLVLSLAGREAGPVLFQHDAQPPGAVRLGGAQGHEVRVTPALRLGLRNQNFNDI